MYRGDYRKKLKNISKSSPATTAIKLREDFIILPGVRPSSRRGLEPGVPRGYLNALAMT